MMNNPKGCQPVLIKISKHLFFMFLLFASCSNAPQKKDISRSVNDELIRQKLKIKIIKDNKVEKITVHSLINRTKKHAILNGVGTFNKHIFKLEIINNNYMFYEFINNTTEQGCIDNFDILPIDSDFIFNKLDINAKQPLIISDTNNNIEAKITVLEQYNN